MSFPNIIRFLHKYRDKEIGIYIENIDYGINILRNKDEIVAPNIIKITYNYPLTKGFNFEYQIF